MPPPTADQLAAAAAAEKKRLDDEARARRPSGLIPRSPTPLPSAPPLEGAGGILDGSTPVKDMSLEQKERARKALREKAREQRRQAGETYSDLASSEDNNEDQAADDFADEALPDLAADGDEEEGDGLGDDAWDYDGGMRPPISQAFLAKLQRFGDPAHRPQSRYGMNVPTPQELMEMNSDMEENARSSHARRMSAKAQTTKCLKSLEVALASSADNPTLSEDVLEALMKILSKAEYQIVVWDALRAHLEIIGPNTQEMRGDQAKFETWLTKELTDFGDKYETFSHLHAQVQKRVRDLQQAIQHEEDRRVDKVRLDREYNEKQAAEKAYVATKE